MFQFDLAHLVDVICLKLTFQVDKRFGVNLAHALGANLAPDIVVLMSINEAIVKFLLIISNS
jgi:hypothetical protein